MNDSTAIFLPRTAVEHAPPPVREWLAMALGLRLGGASPTVVAKFEPSQLGLARLDDVQARRFIEPPMQQSTRELLRAVVELGPTFRWPDLARRMNCPVEDYAPLRGGFTGLLKRTRNVTDDPKAVLFAWPGWDDLEYEDAVGMMDPETHAALRRALGIDLPSVVTVRGD